jgi:hypothetical protein
MSAARAAQQHVRAQKMILWLLLLILVPVAASIWAKKHAPQHLGAIAGAGLGLVASPVSLGLYATYFLGPLGIVTGMAGLGLVLWHVAPGYYICTSLGFVPTHTVVQGVSQVAVEVSNGIFWGIVYGAFGYGIDHLRRKRKAL